jgi:hypothetical protein
MVLQEKSLFPYRFDKRQTTGILSTERYAAGKQTILSYGSAI